MHFSGRQVLISSITRGNCDGRTHMKRIFTDAASRALLKKQVTFLFFKSALA